MEKKWKISQQYNCPKYHQSDHYRPTVDQYHQVPTSTTLYWPSTTKYQPVPPCTDPVLPSANQYHHILAQYYQVLTSYAL